MLILESAETEVDTSWKEPDEEVQVEEERWPCGRLVLGDGCNDRNVDLRIASVPEGVETTSPWGNDARYCKENETSE